LKIPGENSTVCSSIIPVQLKGIGAADNLEIA